MPDRCVLIAVALLALLVSALVPTAAHAHKLRAFASVEGTVIRGLVFFGGSAPAQGVAVTVSAPDGSVLATTTTDEQGHFSIQAWRRVDHHIVADAGDGHRAEYVVSADDLPSSLPESVPGGAQAIPGAQAAGLGSEGGPPDAEAVTAMPVPAPGGTPAAGAIDAAAVAAMVDVAVARQLRPMREQLAEFEERVLVRDVLGGLGYLLGVTGLALWLRDRRSGIGR